MSVATYLIGSLSIRHQGRNETRATSISLPNPRAYYGHHSPKILYIRCLECFKLLPEKVDCLVIVNANLSSLAITKMVVDEARNFSKKVVVISATVARIMKVVKDADIMGVRSGDYLLMISPFQKTAEFILLEKNPDKFRPVLREVGRIEDIIIDTDRIQKREKPDFTAVVYQKDNDQNPIQIFHRFPNVKLIPYEKFFWLICHGGIEKGFRSIGMFPTKDVVNFSPGFDAYIYQDPTRYELVPFGTEFPFSMKPYYIQNNHFQHQIHFAPEPIEKQNEIIMVSESICGSRLFSPREVNQVVVYFDENGIPQPGDINGIVDSCDHISATPSSSTSTPGDSTSGDSASRYSTTRLFPSGDSTPRNSVTEYSIPRVSPSGDSTSGNSASRYSTSRLSPSGDSASRYSTTRLFPSGDSTPRNSVTEYSIPRVSPSGDSTSGNSASRYSTTRLSPSGDSIPRFSPTMYSTSRSFPSGYSTPRSSVSVRSLDYDVTRRFNEVRISEDVLNTSCGIRSEPPEDPLPEFNLSNAKKTYLPEFEKDGIRIVLRLDGFCGITVTKNGKTEMFKKNEQDDDWIPMYISLKSGAPNVGGVALEDYKTDPQAVIFDLFKFLGRKFSEIIVDPQWKFELIPQENENFLIKVKTSKGDKELDPELILAIVLKSLKLLAEVNLGQNRIEVKTDFDLTEELKKILENGCKKIGLVFDQ